ncbi:MAG: hypothetical protein R3B96_05250 [Pirellulaceae bacterium]
MMARAAIAEHDGPVVVLAGDSPMVRPASLRRLLDAYAPGRPKCLLGTLLKDDPTGLGRIVRDGAGAFVGIVGQKDATPEQLAINEVNMSTYVFEAAAAAQRAGSAPGEQRSTRVLSHRLPQHSLVDGGPGRCVAGAGTLQALTASTRSMSWRWSRPNWRNSRDNERAEDLQRSSQPGLARKICEFLNLQPQ